MARPTVSDSGFDFRTPPRREVKRFEPPPWERDAFDELERKKTEEQSEAKEAEPQQESSPGTRDELNTPEPTAERDEAVEGTEAPVQPPEEAAELDEKQVLEMMADLAAEEPRIHEMTWKPALFSALVVGAFGVVMVVWGIAAMVKTRGAGLVGVAGAIVLLGFGFGFVVLALWITVRTLRQRGVL
jgi:hypothetical protein